MSIDYLGRIRRFKRFPTSGVPYSSAARGGKSNFPGNAASEPSAIGENDLKKVVRIRSAALEDLLNGEITLILENAAELCPRACECSLTPWISRRDFRVFCAFQGLLLKRGKHQYGEQTDNPDREYLGGNSRPGTRAPLQYVTSELCCPQSEPTIRLLMRKPHSDRSENNAAPDSAFTTLGRLRRNVVTIQFKLSVGLFWLVPARTMQKTGPEKDSLGLRMFCRIFAVYGIRIQRVPQRDGLLEAKQSNTVFYLIRVVVLSSFAVFLVGNTYALYDYLSDKASLLDFVRISYNLTSYGTILMSLRVLRRNQRDLSEILFHSEFFTNKFHLSSFRRALLYNFPSFVIDLFLAVDAFVRARPNIIIAGYLCGVYVWQGQMVAFCMYMQLQAIIRSQLEQLTDMVRASSFNEDSIRHIARAKQSIRHTIERVNAIFGDFLLVYYVKMFTLVTLRIGAIILWGSENYLPVFLNTVFGIGLCLQIVQMYGTTGVGSDIIFESQKLERYLYQPRRTWDDLRQKALTEIRRVLRYHEYFDALLISESFVNQRATTFTFLGTMFTCVAIILQFDCDILKILELARSDLD